MKKILLAFDDSHFSKGAFEFARLINESEPILLTGVFLPQVDFANLWSYSGDGITGPSHISHMESVDAETVAKNVERFESVCQKNNIDYRVHKDFTDLALPELRKETRFADLLIIGSESFYENLGTDTPNEYQKDALHASECPVVVVPEKFGFFDTNILAYDGSKASIHAIKQFAYLFPELAKNKTLLVYANEDADNEIPDQVYIEELAGRHFPDLTITRLHIDPKKEFSKWINEKTNAIVISGSFGRSLFSQALKKSFISEVIKGHKLPAFVTHQ